MNNEPHIDLGEISDLKHKINNKQLLSFASFSKITITYKYFNQFPLSLEDSDNVLRHI